MPDSQRILGRLERPGCWDGSLEVSDTARLEYSAQGLVYVTADQRRDVAPDQVRLQLSDWADPQTGLLSRWRRPRHWLHVRVTGIGETLLRLSASVPDPSQLDGIPDQNQPGFEVPLKPLLQALETALVLGATMARGIELPTHAPLLLEPDHEPVAEPPSPEPLESVPSTHPEPEQIKDADSLRGRRTWWSLGAACLFLASALTALTSITGALVALGWCTLGFHVARWGWGVPNADPVEHTRRWLPRFIGPQVTSKKSVRDGLEWSVFIGLGIFYGMALMAQGDDATILDQLQLPILIWVGIIAAVASYNFVVEAQAATCALKLLLGRPRRGVLLPRKGIPLQRTTDITSYSQGGGRSRSHWHDFYTHIKAYPADVMVETTDGNVQVNTTHLRWAVDQPMVNDTDARIIWQLPAFARVLVLDGTRPLLFAAHPGSPGKVLAVRLFVFGLSTVGMLVSCALLLPIILA